MILEVGYLRDDEITLACEIVEEAGADFVKTSTGFAGKLDQAKHAEYVRLIKRVVGDRLKIKAAGGIGSFGAARLLIENGATRLGTSGSLQIVE